MIAHRKIALLGGDARQVTAADRLLKSGYCVSFFAGACVEGLSLDSASSLEDSLSGTNAVLLPLPTSTDGVHLNAPFYEGKAIELLEVIKKMPPTALLIGGKIPEVMAKEAEKLGIQAVDYFGSEAFQIKNAYTTAEAAVYIAMNNMKKNLRGARFAITGYGRISRALTELLLSFGARVRVLARKESDLAWASLAGAEAVKLNESSIRELKNGYDIIFNTAPAYLFFEDFLREMDGETLIVDLASAPGGVDVSAAKRCGAKVLWAASLPGKYAPISAGELIADCVCDICDVNTVESEVKE